MGRDEKDDLLLRTKGRSSWSPFRFVTAGSRSTVSRRSTGRPALPTVRLSCCRAATRRRLFVFAGLMAELGDGQDVRTA